MHDQSGTVVCPIAKEWHIIHQKLLAVAKLKDIEPPPIPLILAGWNFSSDMDKRRRWQEMQDWARRHGLAGEIPALPRESMYIVRSISSRRPYEDL